MFVFTILEKMKEKRLKFSQGVEVLQKMANYQEARVKVTNTQFNKLKFAAKNKAGLILRLNKKNFEDEELSHELSHHQLQEPLRMTYHPITEYPFSVMGWGSQSQCVLQPMMA